MTSAASGQSPVASITGPDHRSRAIRASPLRAARFTEKRDRHVAAFREQTARRDEPVAAVVAGTRDDEDGAMRPEACRDLRHGPACGFHEGHAGDAAGDREGVGLGHLRGGQQLVHLSVPTARPGCAGIR